MKGRYARPDSIAQTIAHDGTSLQGARRFYASHGLVVYAYDRMGMANAARRSWLSPSATRSLSTFLDMVTPSVGGITMQPAGAQPTQLGVNIATDAHGRLRELAEAHQQKPINASRQTIGAVGESPDPNWTWSATLFYDHQYRLRTGEYTTSRPSVTFHVRAGVEPSRADILIEVNRPSDYVQVQRWITSVLPQEERWSSLPVALFDGYERHAQIRSIASAIGAGGEVVVAQGNTQRVAGDRGAAGSPTGEFEQALREGSYKTGAHGLEALIERAENTDYAVVAAFDLYYWLQTSKGPRTAVRLRVKQHGRDPLHLEWGSVRDGVAQSGQPLPGPLSLRESWGDMTAASWDDAERMAQLRTAWTTLIDAAQSGANAAAA